MQIGSGTYARVFTDKQNNEILLRVEDILPDNPLRDAKMTIKLQKQLAVHGIAPELYESFEVPRDRHDRKEVKKFLVTVMERYSCDLMSFIKTKESDTTLLGMNIAHLFKRLAKRHIMCADLKPQNIVLNSKMIDGVLVPMEMRLIDFGADFCDVDVFGVLDGYVFSDNFDNEYTRLSADSSSCYFDVYMNGLEPERYYKILISSSIDGNQYVLDNDYYFKIING